MTSLSNKKYNIIKIQFLKKQSTDIYQLIDELDYNALLTNWITMPCSQKDHI